MTNPSSEVAVTGFLSEVKVTKFMSEAAGTEPFDSFSNRLPGRLCGDLFQRFKFCIVRYNMYKHRKWLLLLEVAPRIVVCALDHQSARQTRTISPEDAVNFVTAVAPQVSLNGNKLLIILLWTMT